MTMNILWLRVWNGTNTDCILGGYKLDITEWVKAIVILFIMNKGWWIQEAQQTTQNLWYAGCQA
jgi:hypothetical protein